MHSHQVAYRNWKLQLKHWAGVYEAILTSNQPQLTKLEFCIVLLSTHYMLWMILHLIWSLACKTLHRTTPSSHHYGGSSLVAKSCPILATPWSVARQAPLGFFRQEYWSGLPFPSPGDLPDPGDRTQVSRIAGRFFTNWATREAHTLIIPKSMIGWQ